MGTCFGKCFGSKSGKFQGHGATSGYTQSDAEDGLGGRAPNTYATQQNYDQPDADERRKNALAAAERRAAESNMRGVQGSKQTLSPQRPGSSSGRKELNMSDKGAWN
ncbi:hypothetical protein GUITHDRAFT_152810 [Guillardia theta CCMP2712]|uniref:Uncharacterized protein n=1 Tax=Guillardia theta (strain CCMP2712) TaxID=905079 RepID=L1J9H5_GUITC|nr:hypothetical protein GUITHDRAFT_152810 [Guillardia theta CCMP2712]EKX44967.1 hypothetical protein GUITHDRAFT_152810 [Guillardia theta CCMP2712]|mmetsp:Transcript_8702/g.29034  ORF Transcript_8702/g.29034 Transcript_8702/m.29034 type:complete len:107 (-) Transcript_8702:1403-1723(-)|eukprot:XP_005831947.1 hypothetical protein GUITHDRAFT_152810 [Guillardia theta CCMP2712]